MTQRDDLKNWIVEALKFHGGSASIVDVSKHVWENHEPELKLHPKLYYTWQYDLRWAAMVLRKHGVLKPSDECQKGHWDLNT